MLGSLKLLRKNESTGMESRGTIACDICAVGQNQHETHHKSNQHKTRVPPMELVYTLSHGHRTARGGLECTSKLTDDFTMLKEMFLLKSKSDAPQKSPHQYDMNVALAPELRIQRLRTENCGKLIS